MEQLKEAADLVEGLNYLDDLELVNDDIVGCAANAHDVAIYVDILDGV